MKQLLILLSLLALLPSTESFKAQQLRHARVQAAYREKQAALTQFLSRSHLSTKGLQLYLRAFKLEQELEVWARNQDQQPFRLLTTYAFCATSGSFGPKRREGDGQIPEGFYFIDRFHPQSAYHLSLGINYPNAADKIMNQGNLGGDIFLHGDCVTVGCIPITDDKIKELYILAVEAQNAGQPQIPVHLFPCRFGTSAHANLLKKYAPQPLLLQFWQNLETGYLYFEQQKKPPLVQVSSTGTYIFQ